MMDNDLNESLTESDDDEYLSDIDEGPEGNLTRVKAWRLQPDEDGNLIIPDLYNGTIVLNTFTEYSIDPKRKIKSVLANNITKVDIDAFLNNWTLKSINFPNVTFIGRSAFQNCRNLVNVYLPNVTTIESSAFCECSSLEILDLPKVETIASESFISMISLKTIKMYNLNNLIDDYTMFKDCPQLEEIRVGTEEMAQYILDHLDPCCVKAQVYIGDSDKPFEDEGIVNSDFQSFKYSDKYEDIDKKIAKDLLNSENFKDGVLTIPENFNGRIVNESFLCNKTIKSIKTNNINIICKEAFKECKELADVCGDNVTKIEDSAFLCCENLNRIEFPNVRYIGICSFMDCKNLTEISIPNVNKIGSGCFSGCENLTQINNLQQVGEIRNDTFENCIKLQQIDLPTVTKMGQGTFKGCIELQQINIPLVTKIEYNAFEGCTALRQIDLPSITKIEKEAFKECTNLERISIPKIEKLDSNIFNGCENLNEIVTTTAEQCGLIFDSMDDALQRKVKDSECNLLYGDEVWDPQTYIQERLSPAERLLREFEARRQENQQMFDNLIESLKTPKEKIRKGESCSVYLEEFNDSESDDFVCTMHEDSSSGIQHQIHKKCLIGLLKSKRYICPICRTDLGLSEEVKEAIEELVYLEEHNND